MADGNMSEYSFVRDETESGVFHFEANVVQVVCCFSFCAFILFSHYYSLEFWWKISFKFACIILQMLI